MSIEKTWGEINDAQDSDLSSLLNTSKLLKLSSQNPLKKIKRNLLINIIWCSLICLIYILVIAYFNIWQVQLAISVVLLFTMWALYTAFIQFKKMNTDVSSHSSLLNELKRHYQSIYHWTITQQKVALFVYPISAAGGFMLGGVLGSGKPVESFMYKTEFLIALLITLIILVPACYYLAKWMSNYSFGKHLKTLKENIKALEEE